MAKLLLVAVVLAAVLVAAEGQLRARRPASYASRPRTPRRTLPPRRPVAPPRRAARPWSFPRFRPWRPFQRRVAQRQYTQRRPTQRQYTQRRVTQRQNTQRRVTQRPQESVRQILRGNVPVPQPQQQQSGGRQQRSDNAVPPNGQRANLGNLKTLQDARKLSNGALYFKAGAQIDVDGSGPGHGDPYKQRTTSLTTRNGRALNADKVPYFVLPPQVMKAQGIRKGDVGIISYNGKRVPAVFGDVGPRAKIGEISRYAAQQLGIPDSPVSGGVNSGVSYEVFPGSGSRTPTEEDLTTGALQRRVDQARGQ